jgi:hypothetical protein
MKNKFMVIRNSPGEITQSYSESSYSEACMSIPPADIDDGEYTIICPEGFVPPKVEVEPIKLNDLPF